MRPRFAALACAAALTLTGCGAATPLETPQAEVVGDAVGPDEAVVDLDRSLRSSQSVPVTFTFQRPGP